MEDRGATADGDKGNQYGSMERRGTARLLAPFPVRIVGVATSGERLECEAHLENLCARGLYVRLSEDIREWKRIVMVVKLSLAPSPTVPAPVFVARAEILRVEAQGDGLKGFAVRLTRHRFL